MSVDCASKASSYGAWLRPGVCRKRLSFCSRASAKSYKDKSISRWRVDWLRDVRAVDYYARLCNMIKDSWQLGMVLPVPDLPDNFPLDIRVEQGRHTSNAAVK